MSTSSVRRLKERGGGGAKIIAVPATAKHPKSLTPQSEKPIFSNGRDSLKRPTGKEDPRPTSRARAATATALYQKPVMKAMPRMDKSSAGNGSLNGPSGIENKGEVRAEGRPRWSTSSVLLPAQRGRSSSPSEFNRVLLSSRSSRASSVEKKRGNLKGSSERVSEKSDLGKWVSKDSDKSGEICVKKVVNLSSESVKFNLDDGDEKLNLNGNEKMKSCLVKGVELRGKELKSVSDSGVELSLKGSNVVSKSSKISGLLKEKEGSEPNAKEQKMVNKSSGFSGILKGKEGNEDKRSSSSVSVKYQSKLHEKLAFLEGKVKRIASDIKRTKEILDLSNPDSSKVILSDIQEKISGIEKAMCHVVNNDDSKANLVASNGNDDRKIKTLEKRIENKVDEGKILVKGMNVDELEARLFPHHKLLRDRTSLKSSCGSAQSHEIEVVETDGELNEEEKSANPVDEHPIAMEFLASLSNEQYVGATTVGTVPSEISEVQEMDGAATSAENDCASNLFNGKGAGDITLTADEKIEEFDDQEDLTGMIIEEEADDSILYQLNEIGRKTTTGGWFVSEGESVLLAHDDGSCSFYDITNCEGKAIYKPPDGVSPNMWRDCWLIRAPGADGCSGRYVVAASVGNSMVSGFCSWDLYTKDVRAFHTENGTSSVRTALAPLPNNTIYRRNVLSTSTVPENQQCWYRPCGPLIASAANCQRIVRVYDIRDGEHIMKWELQKSVSGMDYSSPLHWRNRGKVVIAESEAISLWDVNSLHSQALSSISLSNRKVIALHVNNTDAELGGGVRQRVSSSEEGNDGVFCTSDSINVLDFRQPTGIGLKIPKVGIDVQSVFSRSDSIFLGCTNLRSAGRKQYCCQIQQFSLRKQRLYSTYAIPESDSHSHPSAITQVWGNSDHVMGVNAQGLFVFDTLREDVLQSFNNPDDGGNLQNVREVIGPDDLYCPSFDYLASRVLLVSRDRPALWRHLL